MCIWIFRKFPPKESSAFCSAAQQQQQHIAIYISIALKRKICGKSVKKIVSKWLLACVVNESGGGGSGARSLAKNTKQKKLCVARALATRTYASLIFATIKKKCKFVSVFWQIVYIFEFIFARRNKYICVVFRKKYKICIWHENL